jgi:hypothetical protein
MNIKGGKMNIKKISFSVVIISLILCSVMVFMAGCAIENNSGGNPPSNDIEISNVANAWIFLDEDEPSGTNYNTTGDDTTGSCYQRLITEGVYKSVDILFICFVTTVQTSSTTVPTGNGSSYTIQIKEAGHPGGLTNQDYMNYVIRDARNANPDIKILVTLNYQPENLISQIFTSSDYEGDAAQFADNLMAYLKYYNLDGFDIDWESPLSSWTTQEQFKYLINAIGDRFRQEKQHTGKKYYLTISPAVANNLDADAINNNVDFLNLQLYSGFTYPDKFTGAGINQNLLAYGAKFEALYAGGPEDQGYEDAQHAYNTGTALGYTIFTNWRLNSTNFVFEQNQQKILYNLVH